MSDEVRRSQVREKLIDLERAKTTKSMKLRKRARQR